MGTRIRKKNRKKKGEKQSQRFGRFRRGKSQENEEENGRQEKGGEKKEEEKGGVERRRRFRFGSGKQKEKEEKARKGGRSRSRRRRPRRVGTRQIDGRARVQREAVDRPSRILHRSGIGTAETWQERHLPQHYRVGEGQKSL